MLAELPLATDAPTAQPDQINAILDSCPSSPESALSAIAQLDLATIPSSPPENDKAGACVVLPVTKQQPDQIRYLLGATALTERDVVKAKHAFLKGAGWVIEIRLKGFGRKNLNRLAEESFDNAPPQNEAAIVLDGVVPRFQETHFGRIVQISGEFSGNEAAELAALKTRAAQKS